MSGFESVEAAVKAVRKADRDHGVLTVERVCDEALKQFPESAILWAYLADAQLSRGNLEVAQETLKTALSKDPDCVLARALKMRLHLFMADDAIAEQEAEWLSRQPYLDIDSRMMLSDYYTLKGDSRGRQLIEAVVADFPDDIEALVRQISTLRSASDYPAASRKVKELQRLEPQHAYTFFELGREAAHHKDFVESERLTRIGLDKRPESWSGWAELANRLAFVGNWVEAEEFAKKALSINNRSALAYRALKWVAEHDRDAEVAERYHRLANEAVPREQHLNAMNDAVVFAKKGRIQEALDAIEQALESPRKNTRVYSLHIKIGILTKSRNWVDLEQALNQLEAEGDRPALFFSGHVKVCMARKQLRQAWSWVIDGLNNWPNSGELRADQIRLSHRYLTRKERYASLKEAVMVDYKMPSEAIHVINAMLASYQLETAMLLIRRGRELFPDKSDWDKLEKQANINWNLRYGSVFDVSKSLSPVKKVLAVVTRSLLKLALTLQFGPPRRPK